MLRLQFQPFPELKTSRLVLRQLTKDDAPAIYVLRSDEAVLKFVHREPAASLQDAEAFIRRIHDNTVTGEGILWGIALREESSRLIGTICYWQIQPEDYRAEIGFVLHPDYWRKGIMKEAVLKVIEYGFTGMGLHSIEARIDPVNEGSAALLESTGFVKEGFFKENFYFTGCFLDTAVYSLIHPGK